MVGERFTEVNALDDSAGALQDCGVNLEGVSLVKGELVEVSEPLGKEGIGLGGLPSRRADRTMLPTLLRSVRSQPEFRFFEMDHPEPSRTWR